MHLSLWTFTQCSLNRRYQLRLKLLSLYQRGSHFLHKSGKLLAKQGNFRDQFLIWTDVVIRVFKYFQPEPESELTSGNQSHSSVPSCTWCTSAKGRRSLPGCSCCRMGWASSPGHTMIPLVVAIVIGFFTFVCLCFFAVAVAVWECF